MLARYVSSALFRHSPDVLTGKGGCSCAHYVIRPTGGRARDSNSCGITNLGLSRSHLNGHASVVTLEPEIAEECMETAVDAVEDGTTLRVPRSSFAFGTLREEGGKARGHVPGQTNTTYSH